MMCLGIGFLVGLVGSPSAQEIVNNASLAQYYAGNDGRARVSLLIKDKAGRKMKRQFSILRKDVADGGEQRFLVLFEKPADVRKTAFLVHKNPSSYDERWLYLPSLDLVKRIAASDERTRFVGSHLLYEDISGRGPKEDTHVLDSEDEEYWYIKSVPKNPKIVEFSGYRVQIRKSDHLPQQIEYIDAKGKVFRRVRAVSVKMLSGHPVITRMKIEDLRSGGGNSGGLFAGLIRQWYSVRYIY